MRFRRIFKQVPRGRVAATLLLLAGCDRGGEPVANDTPAAAAGERMEQAAIAQGLVPDPAAATLTGLWARDTDRLCIADSGKGVPAGQQRIGIVTDFGDGQGCIASGSVLRRGTRLHVTFGRCRFLATMDAGHIVFPGELPAGCEALCRGRASLTGLDVEQQSASVSEATMLRSRGGRSVCT